MRRLFALSLALAFGVAAVACSQSSSHPPGTDGCKGDLCYPGSNPPSINSGGGGTDAGSDGAADSASAADTAPPIDAPID